MSTVKPIKGKMRLVMLISLSVHIIFCIPTVGTGHENTAWPPWITLIGCFNYSSNNATSNIQNNEPTKCFEMCQGNQTVGLKNMSCICNPMNTSNGIRLNRLCNVSCPGKSGFFCGSEGAGNELMSVYTRDKPLPDGINESTSYGCGYVVISGGNKTVHTTNGNTSLHIDYLCYDDFASQCKPGTSMLSTCEDANKECNSGSNRLITASDLSSCGTGISFIGTYWIGLYREKPASTASTATATTSTSSTSSKPSPSFKTTTDSKSNHNSDTPVMEQTSNASSSDGINVVAETTMLSDEKKNTTAAVVGSIVGAVIIVAPLVVICRKKRILFFKSNKESLTPGPADVESRQAQSNRETSEKKPTVNSEKAMRDIEANIDDMAKISHHMGAPSIVSGPSSKQVEDNSELEKRRRKGKRTKLDKNDQNVGTSVNESTNIETNTENHGGFADILSLTTGYSFVKSEGKEITMNKTTKEMYAEPQQPPERNITTASGVRLSVDNLPGPMYDYRDPSKETNNDHNAERDRKKHNKRSKTPPDVGTFDMPPGKSKTTSRKKPRKSRVFPVSRKFDVPADKEKVN